MTLNKRLGAAPVNRTEGLSIISKSKQKDKRLEDINRLDAEVIELEGKENNRLEGNKGVIAI